MEPNKACSHMSILSHPPLPPSARQSSPTAQMWLPAAVAAFHCSFPVADLDLTSPPSSMCETSTFRNFVLTGLFSLFSSITSLTSPRQWPHTTLYWSDKHAYGMEKNAFVLLRAPSTFVIIPLGSVLRYLRYIQYPFFLQEESLLFFTAISGFSLLFTPTRALPWVANHRQPQILAQRRHSYHPRYDYLN